MKKIIIVSLLITTLSGSVFADTDGEIASLETQLNDLQVPTNIAPTAVSQEKLYSVQSRFRTLKKHFGMGLGVSQNFSGSSFLKMTQVNLDFRYHLSDRWSLVVGGSYGFNSFTSSADRLMTDTPDYRTVADAAYVKTRAHILAAYNLFYGKFRLSMDKVLYFDQYIAAGPGMVNTQFGNATSGVFDIGLVFWTGKNLDVRFGIQNEFFNEQRTLSSSFERHTLGHFDVGYTFGGDSSSPERL